jgi:hypothetical protein
MVADGFAILIGLLASSSEVVGKRYRGLAKLGDASG